MISNKHVFYLAPIRGVTDYLFRNTFERYFGTFDYMLAPFITTVKGISVCNSHVRDIAPEHNDCLRLIPQMIGNNPQEMLTLAKKMIELGYKEINWNLGCPYVMVTRKKRGSGLLPYPDLIASVLDSVVPEMPCPFSVKIRLGLDQEQEIEKVIPVLNDYPLSEIIIHPRTAKQMYSGTANLDWFEKALNISKHRVVYNGDIFSLQDFLNVAKRFPEVWRWMLGRGVISNPFLLQCSRMGATVFDIKKLRSFHDDIFIQSRELLSGPSHLLGKMKGIWLYMAGSFPHDKRILKKIQKTGSISNYTDLVNRFFDEQTVLN